MLHFLVAVVLQVANRIDELIKNDRYLTPKEKEERQAIEDAKMLLLMFFMVATLYWHTK